MAGRARGLLARLLRRRPMEPARAYDLWSSSYDQQDDNPLLFLDDEILGGFLATVTLRARVIADVGCGTGRHWTDWWAREPAQIVGYDVSSGMLARLRERHPRATVHQLDGYALPATPDGSRDVVISTLTLGYLADLDAALREWARVLPPGGDLIITDLHPDVAASGDRSFRHRDRLVSIRHHVHPLDRLGRCAAAHGLELVRIEERLVDGSLRRFFDQDDARGMFARLQGKPLMYGAHFKKRAR